LRAHRDARKNEKRSHDDKNPPAIHKLLPNCYLAFSAGGESA
jgi:hypothetical protein